MRKMRQKSRIAAFLTALALMVMCAAPAGTAEAQYNYTVRIYAGQQGTISGSDYVEYGSLNYGDRVNFNLRDVKLKDGSKYYVKGIRLAGRDNNTVNRTSFQVDGDLDYVIAYGLLTDAVAYTIEYVDAEGNPLAPSETYYGNVGDKPVVAFLYIEDYRPEAYNLTKTLSANAADNVFRFVYTRVAVSGPATPPVTDPANPPSDQIQQPGTIQQPDINPGGIPVIPVEEQPGNADDGQGGENDNPGGVTNPDGNGDEQGDNNGGTQEIIDADVPLANGPGQNTPGNGILGGAIGVAIPTPVKVILALIVLAGIWYGGSFIRKKRREG